MGQVLGVSINDRQLATVVMEIESTDVVARNTAELIDSSLESTLDALTQLVDTVPFQVDYITVACAHRAMQAALSDRLASCGSGDPAWYRSVFVTDTPFAFANAAAMQSAYRGSVVVVDVDEQAVPYDELSIAAVDTENIAVIGAVQLPAGAPREPMSDPAGALAVADAIDLLPANATGHAGVFVVGAGAHVPGIAPALEYETQLPVQIADESAFAAAIGAALHGINRRRRGAVASAGSARARNRWVMLALASVAVLAVVIGAIVGIVYANSDDKPAPSTVVSETETVSSSTPPPSPAMTTTDDPIPEPRTNETVPQQQTMQPTTVTVTPPPTTSVPTTTSSSESAAPSEDEGDDTSASEKSDGSSYTGS